MKKILVDMDGRLGNQMFQYAYALKLSMTYPESQIIINFHRVSLYNEMNSIDDWWRDNLQDFKTNYEASEQVLSDFLSENLSSSQYFWTRVNQRLLHHFPFIKRHSFSTYEALPWFLKPYARFLYKQGLLIFPGKTKLELKKISNQSILLHSYFEDARFYETMHSELGEIFTPKQVLLEQNQSLYQAITSTESICITIRRGDYLSEQNKADFFQCDENYFLRGIDLIKEKVAHPTFFFFSDDLDYAREFAQKAMAADDEFYIETPDNPLWEKVRLMSACKHFIISNSTFSWWCQFLSENPEKIVIGPAHWFPKNSLNKNNFLVQENWIKL